MIDVGYLSVLKDATVMPIVKHDFSKSPPRREVTPITEYSPNVPVNKATYLLTEIQQQEKVIRNRINYLV
jgi:hypothetical protein